LPPSLGSTATYRGREAEAIGLDAFILHLIQQIHNARPQFWGVNPQIHLPALDDGGALMLAWQRGKAL
jgi:hypothetical protein